MSEYARCPYCGNTSDIGVCPYCAPVDVYEPVYTATDVDGNEVELTEEEYLALGEDSAVVSWRKRKPNWPWERL